MSAPAIELCDAIVSDLDANKASFDVDFDVSRVALISKAIKEVKDQCKVAVRPLEVLRTRQARGKVHRTIRAGVAVMKKVPAASNTEPDELQAFAEDICEFFDPEASGPRTLADCEDAFLTEAKIETPYVDDMLAEEHVFVCPITLTYIRR